MENAGVFLLPKPFAAALTHESAAGLRTDEVMMEVDGFKIPAFIVSGDPELVDKFIKEAPIKGTSIGNVIARVLANIKKTERPSNDLLGVGKGRVQAGSISAEYPILATAPSVLSEVEQGGYRLIDIKELHEDFHATLLDLSGWAGVRIRLFSPMTGVIRPFPKGKNELHVVIDASPPGEERVLQSTHILETPLCDRGVRIDHAGPVIGYGTLVRDTENNVVAQIVEGTLYLFVPLAAPYQHALIEKTGAGLFKKVLRMAWNAQFEDLPQPTEILLTDEEAYTGVFEQLLREIPDTVRMLLPHHDQEIKEAEAALRKALRGKQRVLGAIRLHEAAVASMNPERWRAEWNTLASLQGIRSIKAIEKGLHIETNLVVSTHGGVRRPLGRYLIRLGYGGAAEDSAISMWCIETLHPNGQPHPHIGDFGNVCFGNVTTAIHKAVFDNRAYAVELILRWLAGGYDPHLAEVKIEEWPAEEEVHADPKLLAPAEVV